MADNYVLGAQVRLEWARKNGYETYGSFEEIKGVTAVSDIGESVELIDVTTVGKYQSASDPHRIRTFVEGFYEASDITIETIAPWEYGGVDVKIFYAGELRITVDTTSESIKDCIVTGKTTSADATDCHQIIRPSSGPENSQSGAWLAPD